MRTGEINEIEAIAIAQRAIEGIVERRGHPAPTVARSGARYVVVFPVNPPRPGQLVARYDAEVTIDVATGRIIRLLVGE
jgi:hypothetical protein